MQLRNWSLDQVSVAVQEPRFARPFGHHFASPSTSRPIIVTTTLFEPFLCPPPQPTSITRPLDPDHEPLRRFTITITFTILTPPHPTISHKITHSAFNTKLIQYRGRITSIHNRNKQLFFTYNKHTITATTKSLQYNMR